MIHQIIITYDDEIGQFNVDGIPTDRIVALGMIGMAQVRIGMTTTLRDPAIKEPGQNIPHLHKL